MLKTRLPALNKLCVTAEPHHPKTIIDVTLYMGCHSNTFHVSDSSQTKEVVVGVVVAKVVAVVADNGGDTSNMPKTRDTAAMMRPD